MFKFSRIVVQIDIRIDCKVYTKVFAGFCRRSILLQFSKGQKKGSRGACAVARLAVRYATNPACGARSKRVVLPWGATGPCRGARARGAIPAGDFHYKGRRITCQYIFSLFFENSYNAKNGLPGFPERPMCIHGAIN